MSQQIDNQIVKMQFDNASFEKNVQESMSTLDKLKAALKFDKVNMTPLQQAFEETEATATKSGFHIRDIWLKVASTIEDQVANKIVESGKKIFNALTMEGVVDGFKEYELKMGSIQTIMAGTGESLATVNKYLDELNTYSDKTIYSFSDMTNSIGKFTNAGVGLKDAVAAIKGIANEAAVSGANSNEASRAMYNFSQALSAGYVKLIDWKSIENANMATKEFKQTLIDVAQGIGTVVKVGDDWQTTTTNMQNKVSDLFNSTKGFNDSLNHQWMTTEVLNNALEIYATDIRDANVNVEEYERHLREDLHLSEEQIEKYEQLGVKAADAATEVKTFTMLIDTLKEAIGSGWAMTWQYFIGDFEQAKALWTEVNDVLGGLIGRMSDARNEFLKEGLQTGWEKFTTLPEMAIPESEKFREVLVDLAREQGVLTKEQYVGINSTQTFVDSLHELNWLTGDLLIESVDDYTNTLKSMTKEERDAMGVSEDQMAQLEKLCQSLNDGSLSADEFAESMGKLGGRENIIQGLRNIFVSLGNVLKPVGEAFDNVFGIMDPQKLFDLTERFRKFTEELKVSEDAANTIRTAFTLAFGGIKTIIEGVGTAIKGFTKLILPVFNLFDAIFGLIGKVVAALTGSKGALDAADKFTKIGDKISDKYLWAMQKLADFINKVADAIRGIPDAVIFTKIHDGVESAIKAFNQFWDEFTNLPIIQQMVEDFWATVAKIEDTVTPMIEAVKKSLGDLGTEVESKLNWETVNSVLTTVYNKVKSFITIIKDFATRIKTFFTNLKEGKSVVESFRESFGDIIDNIQELKQKAKDFFDDLFSKGDELGDKFNLDKIAQSIHDFVANITPEQITMLAIAGTFVLIALNMLRLSEAIKNAIDSLTGIGTALKNVINSYVKKQKSTILQIAEAIVIVAAALLVLSKIPKDELDRAVGALITLTICLGALVGVLTLAGIALNKLGGQKSMVELAAGLAFVAGSFMAVAATLKLLEYVNLEGVLPKILVMSGIMVGLVGLSVLMGKIDRFSRGSLTMLAMSGALLLTANSLAKIGEIPTDKLDKSMDAMFKIMLGLAAITFASGKVGAFSAVGLLAVVLTIDKLIPAIERIVNYDYDKMGSGIEKNKEVLIKLGGLVLIMTAIGAIAGNRIKGAGIAMLSISATFAILLGLSKLASMMKPQELAKGEQFLWSMAGIITLLELCSSRARIGMFGGKNGGEGSKMFIRISIAMGILLGIAKLASMMEWKDIVKGEVAVLGLVGLVLAMIEVAKRAKNAEGVVKSVAGMLFALSLILGEVALLSMIPMGNMLPALGSVLAILGALALLALAVSKNTTIFDRATQMKASTAGALIGAMVTVVALGVVMTQLAKEPIQNVGAAALAVVGIIAAMSLFARAMGKINSGLSVGQIKAFLEAAAIVWVVSEFLQHLISYMKDNSIDPNVMLKAAGAIAIVLVGLTPALSALSLFRPGGTNYAAMAEAAILAIAVLASVATSIGLLSSLGNPTALIDSALAIAIGLVAICAPIAVLGAVGQLCQNIKLGPMATLVISSIGVLAGVAGAIWALSNYGNPETMIQSAQALAIGLVAISVPIAVLGAVGLMCSNMGLSGAGGMLISVIGAVGALAALAGILVWFSGQIDLNAIRILNEAIPALVTAMAGVSVMAIAIAAAGLILGPLGAAGAGTGALAMLAALGVLSAIILAIMGLGAILNNLKGSEEALTKGLDFVVVIAGKLGEAVGALIGGFGVGLSAQLDPIADNMTSFSEKMITFSNNMKQVNEEALRGCKTLAEAMLYLGAAEFVEAITRWLGFGNIGEMDFTTLGNALAGFCDSIKGIPEDAITKASACSVIAKRLAEVAGSLDLKGGVAGWLFGDKQSMEDFADGVKKLGKAMKDFCLAVEGLPENAVDLAQRAADAAKPLVDFTKTLVSQGGIIQKIVGEKDLGAFGTNLSTFVSGLVSFVGALMALESAAPNYPELIQKCADATTPMVDLARGIENSGGILKGLVGDNTLDIFGDKLVPFARELYTFSLIIKQMATDVPNFGYLITQTANATNSLVTMANSLENMGGVAGFFAGDNTLARFGDTLESFGMSISAYAESIVGVDGNSITSINSAVQSLIDLSIQASFVSADSFNGLKTALTDLSNISVTTLADDFSGPGSQKVVDAISSMFTKMNNVVSSHSKSDLQYYHLYGNNIVTGIIAGINMSYPLLVERLNTMIRNILVILQNGMAESKFTIFGKNIITGIVKGINDNYTSISNALVGEDPKGMIPKIIAILEDKMKAKNFEKYGANVAKGVAKGIEDHIDDAVDAAKKLAEEVEKALPEEWDEHSPSRVTYEFGKFFDFGAANGIDDYARVASSAAENMAEGVVNRANEIISAISSVIDSNIDAEPTIRPVLDTSDITAKAKTIGKLFNTSDLQMAYKASGTINHAYEEKVRQATQSSKEDSKNAPNQINFTQNNYSPKALSRIEIYRDTKNTLSMLKGKVMAHG